MPMIKAKLERIDDRINALEAALVNALDTRLVESGFVPYDDREQADLLKGVVNIVSNGEGGYSNGLGMIAKEGVTNALLICHIQVAESASRDELQQKEFELIEEIKSFARTGVAGMDVVLDSVQQSRLLEHPYGWVVAFVELHPPGSTTH